MFFSRDQEANEKSDAYLASLRRVASSCEFAQLEEELIKDRIALGTKDGGVQAHMLRELPLTLDQVAMCRKSEITQQSLQQFQKQYNEEVSYTRWHMQIGYQPLRDQTDDSDRKRNNQGRQDFRRDGDKKASCWYCERKGKHKSPEDCPAWGERCGKSRKKNHFAKVYKQKVTPQLHQLEYSEESSITESKYIIEEEVANLETKKKQWVAPILMKTKSSECVMEFQIDSGLSCNVISHSLICKLLLDGNPKLQESKSKLQMYDKSVMIPMA